MSNNFQSPSFNMGRPAHPKPPSKPPPGYRGRFGLPSFFGLIVAIDRFVYCTEFSTGTENWSEVMNHR